MHRGIVCGLFSLLVACQPSTENTVQNPDTSAQKPEIAEVTLTGTLWYQDRLYNQLGFMDSADVYKSLRRVSVTLLDAQSQILAQSQTNAIGEFTVTDVPVGDYVLRISAESTHPSGTRFAVTDIHQNLYVVEVPVTVTEESPDVDVRLNVQDRVAGQFNMLDVFYSATDFVSAVSNGSVVVDDLTAVWQWGQSEGSYTCRADNQSCTPGIYVLSDPLYSGDTDEFDDDVLWHEFAHHLESSLYLFDSPGGAHTLHNTTLDLRLSWSEGMASAFAASVKHWLRRNDPGRLSVPNMVGLDLTDYYIDTRGNAAGIALDLTQASSNIYRYATNEVAVAATVLGLASQTDDQTVWGTMLAHLSGNSTADTLESFWDGLVGINRPDAQTLTIWQTQLAQRDVFYRMDALESNQSMQSAKPVDDTVHSLYRNHYTSDIDWHAVTLTAGRRYRFETFDLINGADTQLELYNASEELIQANDDAADCELTPGGCSPLHNGTNFASVIDYQPSVDETVYLKVVTASAVFDNPVDYGYIGRYGSYRIRVSEQP